MDFGSDSRTADTSVRSDSCSTSFLDAKVCDPREIPEEIDVGIVGIPYEGEVTGASGAKEGPQALREASEAYPLRGKYLNMSSSTIIDFASLSVRDCGNVLPVSSDLAETRSRINATVKSIAETAFPVILGGDHYVTYPAFTGVTNATGGEVGIIQLDAHSDTVKDSEAHGEHFHGSVMARIAEHASNGHTNHSVIGLRGYEAHDFKESASEQGLLIHTADDVADRGIEVAVTEAIEHASSGIEQVYLTVDIDCVSPVFAPGTGTTEPAGLSDRDLLRAMDILGSHEAIAALDMMEVAPSLDPTNRTQQLGCTAIMRFLEARFKESKATDTEGKEHQR